jgi:hypothetical protein
MDRDDDVARFRARDVWDRDGERISVGNTSSGGVFFEFRRVDAGAREGEVSGYSMHVSGDDTWDIISELGWGNGEPVDLIEANITEIMQSGVPAWLESIGITPGRPGPLEPHKAQQQFYEARCWNTECDFTGGKVNITIDYRTPYETGYSWLCPNCGMKISTEHSFAPDDD